MLPRANRVVRADEFRNTVRRGRRMSVSSAVIYLSRSAPQDPSRFGFIVSKSVGNSVVRHRVTRRLRAIGLEAVRLQPTGMSVVIRALPGSPSVSWTTLHDEILSGIERSAGQ